MVINKRVVVLVVTLLFIMLITCCLWRFSKVRKKLKGREEVAAREPLHQKYMTIHDRQLEAEQIRQEAFPEPDDSELRMCLGKNGQYTVETRIGSLSKYASSFRCKTASGTPFAVRVYAVPSRDRSNIEKEGLQAATTLLQDGCTASMPVVIRRYRTSKCKLAKPFDGPNTGMCHLVVNELANMDAEQWMSQSPSLPQVKAVSFQVIHALYCLLCSTYYRHGDLKASNVLIFQEPVQSSIPEYQVYHLEGETMYVPWTGVRATLWDFEFYKKINLRENEAAETLDTEKFIRELLAYYAYVGKSRSQQRTQDPVSRHLQWMRKTVHKNPKQTLKLCLLALFKEFKAEPEGDYMVVEAFSCPKKSDPNNKANGGTGV